MTLVTVDDVEINYQGDALISTIKPSHFLDFEFETSPLRPAEISIPISVSANALVTLLINGQQIHSASLQASKNQFPLLHHLRESATQWTESKSTAKLRINIFHQGGEGTCTIFLDDSQPELKPELVQPWSWPYALQASAFFAMAWLTIAGAGIILLAHFRFFGDTIRDFTVLATVLVWILPQLGLPVLSSIPFRPLLRRLYGKTSKQRPRWLAALAVLLILVSGGVRMIFGYWWLRHQYTALIYQSFGVPDKKKEEAARRAFVLIPWRKEAQIIIERQAYGHRNANDMRDFRTYIQGFVNNEEVEPAVKNAPNRDGIPFYLLNKDSTLSDPVPWFASLLPEQEENYNPATTNRALAILSSRNDPQSVLQRKLLEFHHFGEELFNVEAGKSSENIDDVRGKLDRSAKEIAQLLDDYLGNAEVSSSFPYQVACDALGTYYIRECNSKPEKAGDYRESFKWFEKLLQARSQQKTLYNTRIWQRPPEKLDLFYMLCSECRARGSGADRYKNFVENYELCDCTANGIDWDHCPEDTFANRFKESYAEFSHRDAWLSGSFISSDAENELKNTLLGDGWRY